jgi:hypothetical protein
LLASRCSPDDDRRLRDHVAVTPCAKTRSKAELARLRVRVFHRYITILIGKPTGGAIAEVHEQVA